MPQSVVDLINLFSDNNYNETECTIMEERKHHATRTRVEQLLGEGWSIVGRSPLLLARGSAKMEVRSNGIIVAG